MFGGPEEAAGQLAPKARMALQFPLKGPSSLSSGRRSKSILPRGIRSGPRQKTWPVREFWQIYAARVRGGSLISLGPLDTPLGKDRG